MFRTLKEIRDAIPGEFFVRDTRRGLLYFARDVLMAVIAWNLATHIDPTFAKISKHGNKLMGSELVVEVARWITWSV